MENHEEKEIEILREEIDALTISLHIARNRIEALEKELNDYKWRYKSMLDNVIKSKEQKANT